MIALKDLCERDNWTCHLCGKRIPQDVPTTHPKAATRDHITPRSHKGKDDPTNLAAAHRECNEKRGNKGVQKFKRRFKKSPWKEEMERRRQAREAIFNKIRGAA